VRWRRLGDLRQAAQTGTIAGIHSAQFNARLISATRINWVVAFYGCPMPDVTDNSPKNGIGRRVSIRRDDEDFVVAFQPEDYVIFRSQDASELRRVCRFFRWEVLTDTASDVPNLPRQAG
jgi:hypothetical protein